MDAVGLAAVVSDLGSPGFVATGDVDVRLLVRRAQGGSPEAFEALYRATCGRVFALCLRLSGRPDLAEELTQEAYVRAWQNLKSFRGESAFSTWMHRLTVNVVLGHHRRRRNREERETTDELLESAAGASRTRPDAAVDLERAISGLPDGARTVFVLYDVEGYRHDEIADQLGIAVGTSKAQLHRARRLLREALS